VVKTAPEADLRALLRAVFAALERVWAANERVAAEPLLGLDAQLSNWASVPRGTDSARLVYFDVSTPFVRRGGREMLDPEIGLRAMPAPIAWAVRRFALAEVVERYYDLRSVVRDLVANLIKEGARPALATALDEANRFLGRARAGERPIGADEVERYYRLDARIWRGFLTARRLHRAFRSRLLGRPYEYILPDPARAEG
jgi:hypothetical protein